MSMPTPADARTAPRPRPYPLVLAVLVLADVVSAFESTMMISALPRMIAHFQVSAVDGSWVITAFALVAAASAAVCGRLGDIYGRRRMLVVLLAVSAVGSLISISTGTLAGVIAGRAVQGVAGGILPLCYGLIRENLSKERVPVAVAVLASTMMLAGAAGAIVSGVLIDTVGWQYIFVLAAVVAALGALAVLVLPTSSATDRSARVDWLGAVLFAPAVALTLFGIMSISRWGVADARTAGSITAGLVLLAVWSWWELRVEHPLIDIRALGERNQLLVLLITVVVAAGVFGTTGVVVQLIMQSPADAPVGLGLSATVAGIITFAISCFAFLLAPVAGRVSARYGPQRSLVIGSVLGVACGIAFATVSHTIPGMVTALVLLNVGLTFSLTALPTLIIESVPPENTSEATGVNQVARTAFSGVGSAIGGMVLSLSLVPGTRYGTPGAYLGVFSIVVVASVVALALALAVRRRPAGVEAIASTASHQ